MKLSQKAGMQFDCDRPDVYDLDQCNTWNWPKTDEWNHFKKKMGNEWKFRRQSLYVMEVLHCLCTFKFVPPAENGRTSSHEGHYLYLRSPDSSCRRNAKQPVYPAVHLHLHKPPPPPTRKKPKFPAPYHYFSFFIKALPLPAADEKRTQPMVLMHELVTHEDTFFVRNGDDPTRGPWLDRPVCMQGLQKLKVNYTK